MTAGIAADFAAQSVWAFMLAFARVGAIAMLLPGFGEMFVPVRVRLVLALALSFVFMAAQSAVLPAFPDDLLKMTGLIVQEALIGLAIGAAARMIMSALHVAGAIVAMQTGLGFVSSVDPTQNAQGALVGTFLSIFAVTIVFATGLYSVAIGAIDGSYALFPPGKAIVIGDFLEFAVRTLSASFAVGVQLAAPFLVFGLVFNLGMGVLSKLVPQIQIYFVAMPANILLGFVVLALTLGAIALWFSEHFQNALGALAG